MRENTSAFHCPLYCFSKPPPPPPALPPPPPPHCEPSPLESEVSEQKSCRLSPVSLLVEDKKCDVEVEIDENGDGKRKNFLLKSSLKKTTGTDAKEIGKECVKWLDDLGKELAEIREFEPVWRLFNCQSLNISPISISCGKCMQTYQQRFLHVIFEHGELDDEMDVYPACACVII